MTRLRLGSLNQSLQNVICGPYRSLVAFLSFLEIQKDSIDAAGTVEDCDRCSVFDKLTIRFEFLKDLYSSFIKNIPPEMDIYVKYRIRYFLYLWQVNRVDATFILDETTKCDQHDKKVIAALSFYSLIFFAESKSLDYLEENFKNNEVAVKEIKKLVIERDYSALISAMGNFYYYPAIRKECDKMKLLKDTIQFALDDQILGNYQIEREIPLTEPFKSANKRKKFNLVDLNDNDKSLDFEKTDNNTTLVFKDDNSSINIEESINSDSSHYLGDISSLIYTPNLKKKAISISTCVENPDNHKINKNLDITFFDPSPIACDTLVRKMPIEACEDIPKSKAPRTSFNKIEITKRTNACFGEAKIAFDSIVSTNVNQLSDITSIERSLVKNNTVDQSTLNCDISQSNDPNWERTTKNDESLSQTVIDGGSEIALETTIVRGNENKTNFETIFSETTFSKKTILPELRTDPFIDISSFDTTRPTKIIGREKTDFESFSELDQRGSEFSFDDLIRRCKNRSTVRTPFVHSPISSDTIVPKNKIKAMEISKSNILTDQHLDRKKSDEKSFGDTSPFCKTSASKRDTVLKPNGNLSLDDSNRFFPQSEYAPTCFFTPSQSKAKMFPWQSKLFDDNSCDYICSPKFSVRLLHSKKKVADSPMPNILDQTICDSFVQKNDNEYLEGSLKEVHVRYDESFETSIFHNTSIQAFNSFRFEKYNCVKMLGEGGFSKVYEVINSDDNKNYALKVIFYSENIQPDLVEKEIKIMQLMSDSERSIKLIESRTGKSGALIVMEKALTDLKIFFMNRRGSVTAQCILHYWQEMLLCVKAIHDKRIAHLDLKLQNFVLTETFAVKLIDYGISRELSPDTSIIYDPGTPGTVVFMSPELLDNECAIVPKKCDIWSMGIILYSLIYDSQPLFTNGISTFIASSVDEFTKYILSDDYSISMPKKKNATRHLLNLMNKCLLKDVEERATVEELLETIERFE